MALARMTSTIVRGDGERFRLEGARNGDHGMWTCAVFHGPRDDEVRVEEWGAPDVVNAAGRFERFAATAAKRATDRRVGA